jgi:6-phosphogluconate dehydrogenase (decarboxylating)
MLFCRRVIILVKAGAAVDETIKSLMEYMEDGDIIIDGGNEWCALQCHPTAPVMNKTTAARRCKSSVMLVDYLAASA